MVDKLCHKMSSSYREAMAGVAGGIAGNSSNNNQLHGGTAPKKIDGSLTSTSFYH
jgi:hypothetical protein